MKYVIIDINRNSIAFYDSEIHESNILEDSIKISDTDWYSHINDQRKVYDSTPEIWVDYVLLETEVLNQVKKLNLLRLN